MVQTNIKLYGTNWCSDCKRSKKFLGEQRVHYEYINIEEDTERLDNYPGFPEGVTGAEFAERVIAQAKRYGVELLSAQNVISIQNDDDDHVVTTDSGHRYRSHAVLIATGSTYKRLGVQGEDD